MKKDPLEVLTLVAQTIYDKKGFNIIVLDVRGVSSLFEYAIIAEGKIERHVQSLAKAIIEKLESLGESTWHIEGNQHGDWIVLDYLEIGIHLFTSEMRDKYRLEELWQAGRLIEVALDSATSSKA